VKFTNEGEVCIQALSGDRCDDKIRIEFEVKDTGIGLTDKEISKLFEPFTQADSSLTRKYGGTGLGLAISKNIIEMMDGSVHLSSVKDRGTTVHFTVTFGEARESDLEHIKPVAVEQPADIAIQRDNADYLNTDSPTILLVEDNEINRLFFIRLLESQGFECDIAKNGVEAVEACRKKDYDIIFMDCQMPEMDGYEATKEIRKLQRHKTRSLIIALTAYAMNGDESKCLEAGMDGYLSKPVKPDQIKKILKNDGVRHETASQLVTMPKGNQFLRILHALMEASGLNKDACIELLRDFIELSEPLIAKIKKSLAAADSEQALILVHQLKGSAGNLRVNSIMTLAARVEKAIREQVPEQVDVLIKEIEERLKDLKQESTEGYDSNDR
jgi:CheY-like chemotaxis protein